MKLQEMDPEVYKVIGAAMKVHQELGCGFLEAVYADALEIEFQKRGIPYVKEKLVNVFYSNIKLKSFYKADFICYDGLIVETKAQTSLSPVDSAQTMNYMKGTRLRRAVLINFGEPSLRHKYLSWQTKWDTKSETLSDTNNE